jgi:pimeloyl-ACP methyl ester carboxylesterase
MTELFLTGEPEGIMTQVTFDGCFGWFHPASSGRAGTAVLLCAGAGQDFSNGYRPFRLLAARLAKAGYATLRFDYQGTGDSAEPGSANLWAAWQESITRAASWLGAHASAERLVLIGLRIGGTLAAMAAAERSDVAGLVLIEPCMTGRAYVTQLVTEAKLHGAQQQDGGIEVGELHFTPECLEEMRSVELARFTSPPAPHVAVFCRAPQKAEARLAGWQGQDARLSCHDIGGLDAMLRPSHHSGEPELDPAKLLDWLRHAVPPGAPPRNAGRPLLGPAILNLPGCAETPLQFGTDGHLTGILCRPALDRAPGFAMLICNAGGNPRHGFARFGVECARALARAGFASLRFDFAGLGDSIHNRDGADLQTDPFTVDRTADISAALDALEMLRFKRFALHGLCSGAYHAVHGACADPRVTMLLAVNLPWFSLQHERPGPRSVAQGCIDRLTARGTAALFLFGDKDPGVKPFEQHFGTGGGLLPASSAIRFCTVSGLDHELTVGWMRREVAARIIDFIREPPTGVPEAHRREYHHDHP